MAGEIFISYRRADEHWARLLHSELHAENVEAWYDAQVGAGQDWRIATAKALEASQIFVLLFSQNASQSSDIAKELAAATLEKKLIIPVRLENIPPKGAFLYELASRNWVNAFEDTEAKLSQLAKELAHLVRTNARDENALPFDHFDSSGGSRTPARNAMRKPAIIGAAAIALMVAVVVFAWLYMKPAAVTVSSHHPRPAAISIAVLPFLNLSSDKDQEYFSDGITEEITSALAKVPGLTVIGRTSAFQFKGQNKDMRAIGGALGVKNLIEGSVRKAGDQVRITAQLIRADDGTNLWTESYDRKLTDIFVVQEEIASAISMAMRVPLGLTQGGLVPNRTGNLLAYQQYLQALAFYRGRKLDDARALLTQVVASDPGFAPGWGLLGATSTAVNAYQAVAETAASGSTQQAHLLVQSISNRAEQAADEAIRLDPRLARAYTVLGAVQGLRGNWAGYEDSNRQALLLDPNDPDIQYGRAFLLAQTGRLEEARDVQTQIQAQEPFVPNYRRQAADVLWDLGRNDAAIQMLETMDPAVGGVTLAKAYATAGRYGRAADTLLAVPGSNIATRKNLEDAARLLRAAPAAAAPGSLPELGRSLNWVYLFVGAPDRSLRIIEREFAAGYYGGVFREIWAPPSGALRKTEHFKMFVRNAHLVEYWRARGWPKFCHPVGGRDFACD